MAEDEGVPDRERALRDDVLSGDPLRRPTERIAGRLVMTSEPQRYRVERVDLCGIDLLGPGGRVLANPEAYFPGASSPSFRARRASVTASTFSSPAARRTTPACRLSASAISRRSTAANLPFNESDSAGSG